MKKPLSARERKRRHRLDREIKEAVGRREDKFICDKLGTKPIQPLAILIAKWMRWIGKLSLIALFLGMAWKILFVL